MNLLIVFALAGDSTMTRFLAIAERPKRRARATIFRGASAVCDSTHGGGLAVVDRWLLAVGRGTQSRPSVNGQRPTTLLRRPERPPPCTSWSCCRASYTS